MSEVGQEFTYSKQGNVITLKHPLSQTLRLTLQKDGS